VSPVSLEGLNEFFLMAWRAMGSSRKRFSSWVPGPTPSPDSWDRYGGL